MTKSYDSIQNTIDLVMEEKSYEPLEDLLESSCDGEDIDNIDICIQLFTDEYVYMHWLLIKKSIEIK